MVTDAELVKAAQGGDTASLGLLLERYQASLYGLALQILGYGPQAQEAIQDTFLMALRKIDQVREPAAVGGWLHTILRNVCRMQLRERQGEILFDELPDYVEKASLEPSAEQAIERLAMREWVWTAFGELPEALRVTAMLRYFGSYASYEEIAAILGVPVGTVCSRLSQVKLKLAEALLKTAGLAHDHSRHLAESRTRHFTAALDEMNRGRGYDVFLGTFSDDPLVTYSNGTVLYGYRRLAEDLEGFLEAKTKIHLTNVIASEGITIIEADCENHPDAPFHCPPAVCQVHFQRGDKTHQERVYSAPRPSREVDREKV